MNHIIQRFNRLITEVNWDKFRVVLLVFLVGVGGFGLGRLSSLEKDTTGITIQRSHNDSSVMEVIASKRGSKYFYPWCGGSSNIKDENLIRFESSIKAETEGYSLAKNCKGIE